MKLQLSPILNRYGQQQARPVPPVWFADAVEKWARDWGRRSTTRWEPMMGCFVTHLSRRDSDPVLAAVQEGRRQNEGEPVYWHVWKDGVRVHPISRKLVGGFVPMDIEQMGEAGVLEYLNKSNVWSGRGEHASLMAAADASEAQHAKKHHDQEQLVADAVRDPLKATIAKARGDARTTVLANFTD